MYSVSTFASLYCTFVCLHVLSRPDLKVILMSATINADLFSRYFGEFNPLCLVGGSSNHSQYITGLFVGLA